VTSGASWEQWKFFFCKNVTILSVAMIFATAQNCQKSCQFFCYNHGIYTFESCKEHIQHVKLDPANYPQNVLSAFQFQNFIFPLFFTDIDQLEKFKFCGLASACNRRDWGYGAGLPDFS
jgi:hypothetical protein